MAKDISVGVVIGATMAASFKTVVGGVRHQFAQVGDEIKALSTQRGLIERFEKDEAALEKTRHELAATQQQIGKLKLALRKNPADEGTAKTLEQTTAKADKLARSLDRQKQKLGDSRSAMTRVGMTVENLGGQYHKLGSEIERAAAKQAKMRDRMSAKNAAGSRLGDLKGAAVGAVGAVYGVGRMIGQAMDFEHEMRMFGNIAGLSNAQLGDMHSQIKALSKETNQTPGELLVALNDLTAKGLDADKAVASLGIIGKTATASGANIGDLAATAFTLIDAMGLSPDELPAAMNILTQAGKDGSFELKDMAQYFPMLTAQAKSLGMVGKEGIATLGSALQVAMKGASDPAAAANNFQNFLAKLTSPETVAKFAKMGVNIEDAIKASLAEGKNPIEEMIRLVDELTGGDKFRIGELFGDMQVINFLNPMLQNLEEFDRIKKTALSADGIVDKDFETMLATGKETLKQFTIGVISLGETFGKTLLPAAKSVIGAITPMVGWATTMIDKYPAIGELMGYFAIGMSSVAAGIGIVTASTWLWNAALLANPMTWVIGAAVAGVAAIITYWEPITGFFMGLWEGVKSIFSDGVAFLTSVWEMSPIGLLFKAGQALAGWVGGSTSTGAMAPNLPAAAGAAGGSTTVTAPITINAAPGMDETKLAEQVGIELDKRASYGRARSRGKLYDD